MVVVVFFSLSFPDLLCIAIEREREKKKTQQLKMPCLCLFCISRTGDVEGLELLRWEDQLKIRKYVEGAQQAETSAVANTTMECGIEVSQTSRATCRLCTQKILKGEVCYYCFSYCSYIINGCFACLVIVVDNPFLVKQMLCLLPLMHTMLVVYSCN